MLDTYIDCLFASNVNEEIDQNGSHAEYHVNVSINFEQRSWEAGFGIWTSDQGIPVDKEIIRVANLAILEGLIIQGYTDEATQKMTARL